MSLRFVIGRAGSGKSTLCLHEVQEELKQRPRGKTILYLVPEQMTFQTQQALIGSEDVRGSIRAQVFSFSRLAWKVLQEVGGASRLHIDEAGVHMLLRKIVESRKDGLSVFQKAAEQNGFFEHLGSMIAEFKRYNVTPSNVYEMWQQLDTHSSSAEQKLLANKVYDLQLLYDDFERALIGKYLDSEDYLQLLIEKLSDSEYVKGAEIYIDGFHSFSPQELEIVRGLMRLGTRVTITLTIDEKTLAQPVNELDLFYETTLTYERIKQVAREEKIEVEKTIPLMEQPRFHSQALAHLEMHYEARPNEKFHGEASVTISTAANLRAEVEGVAREIRRLVAAEDYRYRDIAVLLRNGESYYDVMRTLFTDYNIPHFIDEKRPMSHHPLVECIRSALEIISGNWRYDAVFRCVKTELLYPLDVRKEAMREEMDEFENYCLAYGVQGKRWTSEDPWMYRRYRSLDDASEMITDSEREMEEKINRLRDVVRTPVIRMQKRLKRAGTVMQMCEAVYLFLEELDVPKKLEALRIRAEESGDFLFATDHEQVWEEVMSLLDTFVEMLGEEKMSLSMFTDVMTTGLEALQFANIPPSLDQVLVANIDHSRLSDIKATFIIGVNEGVIPAAPMDEGMLSDEERNVLTAAGIELAPTTRQTLLEEQFVMYQMVTRASEKLYISCPLADEEGKTLLASSFIKKIKRMFPDVKETFITNDVNDLSRSEQISYVATPEVTLSYVMQQLQTWKRYGFEGNLDFWWDVYNFYVTSDEWKQKSSRVLSSLFYRNRAQKLSTDVSRDLYGDTIKGSVSRMELFNRCAYAHFAQHGLSLRERDIFKLDAPDIGELFHAALKRIADKLLRENRTWADLSIKECEHLSALVIEEIAPLLQRQILLSSNRHFYLKQKLQQIIFRTSLILREHAKSSGFVPVDLEVPFGMGGTGSLPPMEFALPNGVKMEVVGRIDRVDKAEDESGTFLRIIDYKSSSKALDLTEVYYGLALQMLTYLDVVTSNAHTWMKKGSTASPAGVLYFHIHNPIVEMKGDASEEEIEKEILKKFKMKGLVLGDADVVRLMDNKLSTGSSDIISAGLKKDGSFSARSSIASEQEFNVLQKYVHHSFENIGKDITEGVIDIAPYKKGNKAACTFCNFKSVCQFDESLEDNQFRMLKDMKDSEAMEKIREEVGGE
ncbi:ATP-dependent helicase/deoxyribonuclease subunit B [Bacillus cereus BAG5X1-1]|uniref:ATP-dependent helicase/deoxyribonuclease subunit B n=1 Tax=Bacillus cereus BAG5X1-1 TaxID=1053189 RepID=J8AU40_BACCE|nr:helicase-exonuclease AddAB subunit AddB [Bacillus cereus]EJQ42259.1 ATP-dependent helicase/deoxyribonuclease subunit B [Bacillus cereus BAG5X1-1]MDM5461331.1 helicase-exonuclease AddAB subunit AddB [Bacillus cereus]PGY17497.1 helicase-exonuclease AddAB subunit AddB [Bacillus cereus]WJE21355.1 helicase-exonuclease AddAB subunit AddB [Bacillus cereus]